MNKKTNQKSTLVKLLMTIGIVATISTPVVAHSFGPPLFRVGSEEAMVFAENCGFTLTTHPETVYFGISNDSVFFRVGTRSQEFSGETYYETFMVRYDHEIPCLNLKYTRSHPYFGTFEQTEASKLGETVVLDTPNGQMEVTQDGRAWLLSRTSDS